MALEKISVQHKLNNSSLNLIPPLIFTAHTVKNNPGALGSSLGWKVLLEKRMATHARIA